MITLNEEAGAMDTAAPQMGISSAVEAAFNKVATNGIILRNLLKTAVRSGQLPPDSYTAICESINELVLSVRNACIETYTENYDERNTLHTIHDSLHSTITNGGVNGYSLTGVVRYEQWHAARLRTEVVQAYAIPVRFIPVSNIQVPTTLEPIPEPVRESPPMTDEEATTVLTGFIGSHHCQLLKTNKQGGDRSYDYYQIKNHLEPTQVHRPSLMQIVLHCNADKLIDAEVLFCRNTRTYYQYVTIFQTDVKTHGLASVVQSLLDIVHWWQTDEFNFIRMFVDGKLEIPHSQRGVWNNKQTEGEVTGG